jgi:hypothetical protein
MPNAPDNAAKPKRKTLYTPEQAQRICDAIAAGQSLRGACAAEQLAASTFLWWESEHADLAEQYARARQQQSEAVDDELRELVAETTPENARAIETKFRMLTWIAGKRSSKRFGDRVGIEGVKDGEPLKVLVEVIGGAEDAGK